VTVRSVLARINRALRDQYCEIRPRILDALGRHGDLAKSEIVQRNIDLAKFAIDQGCLQPFERLED